MEFHRAHSVIDSKLVLELLSFALLALHPVVLSAQGKSSPKFGSESLVFPTDNRVLKRFKDAQDYFAQQQWAQGLEILERTVERFPDVMVPVGTRRYVSVSTFRDHVVASLPAEGLIVYRERVDTQAELWLQTARKFRDPKPLRSILRHAFASSHGDEALELLGSMAWDAGKFETARYYWERILPATNDIGRDSTEVRLLYPDSNLNRAEIRARCVLCSMMLKDWQRVTMEFEAFRKNHLKEEGYLAGSQGILSEKLAAIFKRLKSQKSSSLVDEDDTFAGNPHRNRTYRYNQVLKSAFWSKSFGEKRLQTADRLDFPFRKKPFGHFPVIHQKNVFLCDAYRIWAIELLTGKPAWGNGDGETPKNNDAVIFQSPEFHPNSKSNSQASGTPLHTMTIYNGKLYARMGNPVTHWNSTELRVKPSSIVCLDIEKSEGRLLWSRSSTEFSGRCAFVGTPLVVEGNVYQILQQSHPQKQTHIVCMDSLIGKTLWKRKIYSTISSGNAERNRIAPNLLAYGNDRLYLSTEQGGAIAIDEETGTLDWILTYKRMRRRLREDSDANAIVKPPLFHRGRIYAAPSDSDAVFCIEASSGILLWKRRLPDRIEHLLGAKESGLIVSGKHLWCLDLETGSINWNGPIFQDPTGHGFGRGFLSDEKVFWPTRNRIFTFDFHTGLMASPPIPLHVRNPKASGGNLIPSSDGLLIAEPHRLVYYPRAK